MDYLSMSPVDVNAPFSRRLWAIVTKKSDGAVRWSGDGKTVIIDLDRFTEYAGTHYSGLVASTNIKSFKRQLCKYGFRVLSNTDTRHGRCSVVYHPYFQRGRPDLVHCIQRVDKPHNTHNELNDGIGSQFNGGDDPTDLYGLTEPGEIVSNEDEDSGSETDSKQKFPKIKLNKILKKRPKVHGSLTSTKVKISRSNKVRESREQGSVRDGQGSSNGSPGEVKNTCHCCCSRCPNYASSSCQSSEQCQPKTQKVLLPFLLTPQGYVPLAPAQAPVGLPTDNVSLGILNFMHLMNPVAGNLVNGPGFSSSASAHGDNNPRLREAAVPSSAIKSEEGVLGGRKISQTASGDREGDLKPLRASESSESLADQEQMLANASAVTWQNPIHRK